jgi:hypothetical protein
MSKEKIANLLKEASKELELLNAFKSNEEDVAFINKIRNGEITIFKDIPEHLRTNKIAFKEIIKAPVTFMDMVQTDYNVFGIEFLLEMIDENVDAIAKYVNFYPEYRDDKRVIIAILKQKATYYHYFPALNKDIDLMCEVIEEAPETYSYLNDGTNTKKKMLAYLVGSAQNGKSLRKYRDYTCFSLNGFIKKLTDE